MHLYLKDLLNKEDVKRLMEISKTAKFVDGKQTNPNISVKNNLQTEPTDPAFIEGGQIVSTAIYRHPLIRDFCMPKTMATPMITKYEAGMHYGTHVDASTLNTQPPMRSDISGTIFLADPSTYEGGELSVDIGDSTIDFKGKPGEIILYPSTSLHQVKPVTSGQRVVSILFIHSNIRDAMKRDILYKLSKFINREHQKFDEASRMELEFARENLMRMWTEA